MFGRHASTTTYPDDSTAQPAPPDSTTSDGTEVIDEHAPDPTAPDATTTVVTGPAAVKERATVTVPAVVEPAVTERIATGEPRKWAHVSFLATLSLIVGTLAVAATLTGLLAPLGFAAGILAVVLGILALYSVNRRGVTGHSLLGLGVLFGLVAIVLSVLAIGGHLSWLSSSKDEIATVHTWLNDHMHWLRRW